MNIIQGYGIQVIPSDSGTLIAVDRDQIEAAVANEIQDETDYVQNIDFLCEVVDDTVVVATGSIRSPAPDVFYRTDSIPQTTISGFAPEETGDIFIEISLTEDPTAAILTFFGTVTIGSEYNYSAGMSNKSRFLSAVTITKGIMPPSESGFMRVRLAEYSVDTEGSISVIQTHFGSITIQRPTQQNDFVIFFGPV
jgi:hypothetical protein